MLSLTDKQKRVLSKYIDENRIQKLKSAGFDATSSFINMVICLGNIVSIIHRKPTKEEKEQIEKYANNDTKRYKLLSDEYASLKSVCFIPTCEPWYHVQQEWFKGMSNSPSYKTANLRINGDNFEGVYNMLVDNKIYSINKLLYLYAEELQKENV